MHERRRVWQCKRCGAQTSVTAGTVMHNTQTPLRLWFWAAYLVAMHHPGVSAVQLQRQLGIARHERAWMMLHKLRRAMVAPEREPLKHRVEVDEFFLGGFEAALKGGRARGKKVLCAVTTEPGPIVHTDGWKGYYGLAEFGYDYAPFSQGPQGVGEPPYLPRAHRAISNLEAWMHGTHRRVSRRHLQAYLDEFVFRHNRRGNPHAAFQTLLGLSTQYQPSSYRQIIDEAA
jgi:hypothetical protein